MARPCFTIEGLQIGKDRAFGPSIHVGPKDKHATNEYCHAIVTFIFQNICNFLI